MNQPFFRRILPVITSLALAFLVACQPAENDSAQTGKTAFFLVGEHEYGTPESLPQFAAAHLEPLGIESVFAMAKTDDRASLECHEFTNMDALESADILVLSTRRRFPLESQLAAIRDWIESGKPVIAIRTASHAFGAREKGEGYQPPSGHASWNTFDTDALGAKYGGHYRSKQGQPVLSVDAWIEDDASNHPIIQQLSDKRPFSVGDKLYKYTQVAPEAQVIMSARWDDGEPPQPIAWTYEGDGKRVFYMSPGGTEEMGTPQIQDLLTAAIQWGLEAP